MKKLFILPIIIISTSYFGIAQDLEDVFFSKFGIGFHGTYRYTIVDFKPFTNAEYTPGFGGGLIFNYIGDKNSDGLAKYTGTGYTGFQVEINYNEKGWNEDDTTGSYYRRTSYLEIPFLSHIIWGKQRFKYVLDVGPYIAWQHLDVEKEPTILTNQNGEYFDRWRPYYYRRTEHKFDYGFIAGLGLQYETKAGVIFLQGRFSQGMRGIFYKIGEADKREDILRRSNNRCWCVNVGYHCVITSKKAVVYRKKKIVID
ncbi:MAG: PorT family protein [Bacteroidales bacterium]|nr:PorT family protein [Bacteroidales bacterium]